MDKKTVELGTFSRGAFSRPGRLHVRVDIEISTKMSGDGKPRLSISGDTYYAGAPDIESGGQIREDVRRLLGDDGAALTRPREKILRLLDIWERWHLNDCRAGCEHQRAAWNPLEKIHLVTYKLRTDIWVKQRMVRDLASRKLAEGETVTYAPDEWSLVNLPYEVTRDIDDPAPGPEYEVAKHEEKTAGWVKPAEHPRGILCKPCPECGYKYGSAWLYEPIPEDVVTFLENF
jgi:hypothetical protein